MPRLMYVANALRKYKHFNPTISQEEIAYLSHVGRGTVQAGWKGVPLKESTAGSIFALIERGTPSEWRHWPIEVQSLWVEYRHNEAIAIERESPDFLRFLLNRQHFLEQLPAIKGSNIYAAAYLWMLAWVHHDLALRFKVNKDENIKKSLRLYERVISILNDLKGNQYAFLANKASLAQWATFYASKPEQGRHKDWSVRQWIKNRNILDIAYECAKEEPFAWSAIRNGLVIASVSKSKPDCDAFHGLLIDADPGFAYLDYSPLPGVLPLKDNTDLEFFLANLNSSLVKYRS